MVDFVDSFGSSVCTPLQILFSILAYMGSSGSWWWTTTGWWLWEGEDREIEKKRGIKIINKWIMYSCLLKNKTIDVIWLYQCGCSKYPLFYFYSKNKKYVDALNSCPNKSSNFYSTVQDLVLFFWWVCCLALKPSSLISLFPWSSFADPPLRCCQCISSGSVWVKSWILETKALEIKCWKLLILLGFVWVRSCTKNKYWGRRWKTKAFER